MSNELKQQVNSFFAQESHGPTIWQKINEFRDSGTHADEWLRVFTALLYLSAVFTAAYGGALYYNLTLPFIGHYGALIFALLFVAFIEVGKIIVGRKFARDCFFGLFKQGASAFFTMIAGLLVAVAVFAWSYYNSTKGVTYLTTYIAHYKVERKEVKAATARQDSVSAMATQTAADAMNIKWKNTTTQKGQAIAENATEIVAEAEKQRTIAEQRAYDEQKSQDEHRNRFIDAASFMFNMLGGWMEFIQVFLIFGVVLAEKTLYDRIKTTGKVPSVKAETPPQPAVVVPPQPAFQQQNGAFYNSTTTAEPPAQTRPIGFNVGHDGNVQPRPVTGLPVSQSDTDQGLAESAGAIIGPDEVLKLALRSIQAETANLRNGNGDPVTIKTRIREKITPLLRAINRPDFNGDRDLAERLLNYLEREYIPLANTVQPPDTAQRRQLAESCAHAMNLLIVSLTKYIQS